MKGYEGIGIVGEPDGAKPREFVYVRPGGIVHAFGINYEHKKLRFFVGERVLVVQEDFPFACMVLVFKAWGNDPAIALWRDWITDATNEFREGRWMAAMFPETEAA